MHLCASPQVMGFQAPGGMAESCLRGTSTYQREDVERAIALLHDGTVGLSPMIGARLALVEASQAFDHAASGGAVLKMILVP